MSGLTEKCTMGNGKKTKCTVKACSFGVTAKDTKDSSLMTSVKAAVLSFGKTVASTMANGAKESNTA